MSTVLMPFLLELGSGFQPENLMFYTVHLRFTCAVLDGDIDKAQGEDFPRCLFHF